jgi:hypothetical protein
MKFKDVEFNSNKIVLHKKNEDLIIDRNEIEDIEYVKPTLFNYLLSGIAPGSSTYPGRLQIKTEVKIGKTKLHLIRIKFREVLNLPSWCLKIMDPANMLKREE